MKEENTKEEDLLFHIPDHLLHYFEGLSEDEAVDLILDALEFYQKHGNNLG
jgi:hypothetical protein